MNSRVRAFVIRRTTIATPTRTCTEPGCGNKHQARGYCSTHYNQKLQPNRHAKVEVPCTYCGTLVVKHVANTRNPFCDYTCRDLYGIENKVGVWSKPAKPKPPKRDMRSPLRRAIEAGDGAAILNAIRADCDIRPSGCWEWKRKLHRSGYAAVVVADVNYQVHRLALEARLGKPLGKQAAHHLCANTFCVNPDHLQPVTAVANAAEMHARKYMVGRIKDLEAALALVQPNHPLLAEIGIGIAILGA